VRPALGVDVHEVPFGLGTATLGSLLAHQFLLLVLNCVSVNLGQRTGAG